jgi:hypothetical protein
LPEIHQSRAIGKIPSGEVVKDSIWGCYESPVIVDLEVRFDILLG